MKILPDYFEYENYEEMEKHLTTMAEIYAEKPLISFFAPNDHIEKAAALNYIKTEIIVARRQDACNYEKVNKILIQAIKKFPHMYSEDHLLDPIVRDLSASNDMKKILAGIKRFYAKPQAKPVEMHVREYQYAQLTNN